MKFSNICLNHSDINQFVGIPWQGRKFYPAHFKYKQGTVEGGKRGFFNNGNTIIWDDWQMKPGHLKIAPGQPTDLVKGWSDTWSFEEEGAALRIYKYMKLKAFW